MISVPILDCKVSTATARALGRLRGAPVQEKGDFEQVPGAASVIFPNQLSAKADLDCKAGRSSPPL